MILSDLENKRYFNIFFNLLLSIFWPLVICLTNYYFSIWSIFIWIAFVPFIIIIYRNNLLNFVIFSGVTILLTSGSVTYWVYKFDPRLCAIAFLYVFCGLSLCFVFVRLFFRLVKYPFVIFVFPSVLFILVLLSEFIQGGNVWLGNGFLEPMISPLTWLVGEKGITFLIMLVNSMVAFYFIKRDKRLMRYVFIIIMLLTVSFLYSKFSEPTGKKIRVALIQGNITNEWQWRIKNGDDIYKTYEQLTLEAAKSRPDIIVWPEYSVPEDIFLNKNLYGKISNLAKEANAYLVFGSLETTEKTDPEYNYIKDVAVVFSKNGDYVGKYISVLPFPFDGHTVPGDDFPVFNTELGKFGISTCWEEYYDYINKKYVNEGADFFISIANDNPVGNLNMMKLKSMHVRFRASENRRYVIRAANTGMTEVINPYGKIVASLEPNKEGVLISDIYVKK